MRLPGGLVAGARYRLSVESSADCTLAPIEIDAVAAAELPQQLGATVLATPRRDEVVQLSTTSGSCYSPVPAVLAEVDLELAAEAEPWAALFAYTTRVDGGLWQPSWSNNGISPYAHEGAQTLVFAECPGMLASGQPIDEAVQHQGLAEGSHRVVVEARLPGVEQTLRSEGVEVVLTCSDAAPAAEAKDSHPTANDDPPGGKPAVPASSARGDADGDAGLSAATGEDDADDRRSGDRTYVEMGSDEGNRGCTVVVSRAAAGGSVLVSMLALACSLAVRMRRRAR
jgi:hypothetical protein